MNVYLLAQQEHLKQTMNVNSVAMRLELLIHALLVLTLIVFNAMERLTRSVLNVLLDIYCLKTLPLVYKLPPVLMEMTLSLESTTDKDLVEEPLVNYVVLIVNNAEIMDVSNANLITS